MTTRKAHDFTIDVLPNPNYVYGGKGKRGNRSLYVSRCVQPECDWHSGKLRTRAKAALAAQFHQINVEVQKL